MFNPSFRELQEKGGNRYSLVLLVSKRAREIVAGSEPLVFTDSNRAVSIALEELFEDKIMFSDSKIEEDDIDYHEAVDEIEALEDDNDE